MTGQDHLLVIYDPEGRYQEILQLAQADGIEVIRTDEAPLNARLRASKYWCETLAANPDARLIIYRRRTMPSNNMEWVREPYAAFAQSAQLFPVPPRDDYKNMCEQFLPTKTKELNELFAAGNTSFNFINSLLEGNSYPALENLTHGHSIVEITTKLLNLESCADMNWLGEWQTLAASHYPGLETNVATLEQVQNKLWTYLLFSEFVLDLPESIPESLSSVSHAPGQCQENIFNVCDSLRANHNMRDKYVRAANEVANALNLPDLFSRATHLGDRVTFQFENNVEFTRFINHIKNGELTQAHQMLEKNVNDVWYQEDQGIATFWKLAEQLLALIKCANSGIYTDGSLGDLVDWYARRGYEADKAFRLFYTIKLQNEAPYENELTELLISRYRDFADRCVKAYQGKITEIASTSSLENQVCPQHVYSSLHDGKRVAVVFVDALRYEIGSTFCESLNRIYPKQVTCEPRLSVLPPVTRFGMAHHLDSISMAVIDGVLQPVIGSKPIITVPDRLAYLKDRTNTEMQHFRIGEFSKEKVNENTRLLVLLSTAIDATCEQPSAGVNGITAIQPELKLLAAAVETCHSLGFDEVYFAADHGFMLQPKPKLSDKIDKPAGSNICLEESRCLVGNLNDTPDTLSFTPQELGIDGDFMKISFAKGFTVFRKNEKYYHEGLSLQENVVPIVCVKFKEEQPQETFSVSLKYKGNETGTVRTYSPLLDVAICFSSLFSDDINFKLIVQDQTGQKIGEPAESAFYDGATETVHVPSGTTSFRQRIDIDEEFNDNEFVVLALDCNTNAQLAKIILKFESLT